MGARYTFVEHCLLLLLVLRHQVHLIGRSWIVRFVSETVVLLWRFCRKGEVTTEVLTKSGDVLEIQQDATEGRGISIVIVNPILAKVLRFKQTQCVEGIVHNQQANSITASNAFSTLGSWNQT